MKLSEHLADLPPEKYNRYIIKSLKKTITFNRADFQRWYHVAVGYVDSMEAKQ